MQNSATATRQFASGRTSDAVRPWALLLMSAVLLASAAAVNACAGNSPAQEAARPDVPETAVGASRLWIREGGREVPFENGRSLRVDGMEVEIYVSPYPPGRQASMDFYLTRDGVAVEGAVITLQYDMTAMEHGPFRLLAVPTGRGHYLAPLDFFMAGDFWVNVSLAIGGRDGVINLLVRAHR